MSIAQRSHFATTLFATIVTALVLTSQPGQAQGEGQAATPARGATVVHQLPRVVVTGRVQAPPAVVQLPRVVVTARRAEVPARWLVQAPLRGGERS